MPATVTTTRRHLNVATAIGGFKSQSVHRPHQRYNGMTFRRAYETRIGRSYPTVSRPHKETGCHIAMDCVVESDSATLDVCCAPRRQTIELPLSDDPIEKLIFQSDRSLNLKAPEGEGALGLLL